MRASEQELWREVGVRQSMFRRLFASLRVAKEHQTLNTVCMVVIEYPNPCVNHLSWHMVNIYGWLLILFPKKMIT